VVASFHISHEGYDGRVTAGDPAKRGWGLFNGKARCQLCHALTDNQPDTTLFMITIFTTLVSASLGITWPPWRSRQNAS
jgi:hypothetical protein